MTERAIQVLDRVAPALDRINDRFPWSHNDHFHPWILANLPARRRGAIELGCGQGDLLAQLAGEFRQVHGTDTSAQMRADARVRCAGLDNVVVDDAQLRDLGPETEPEPLDLVTMIAALHHVDADETLAEAARLLSPGGRLLVVGLALSATPRDYLWEGISAATNPVIGIAKNLPPRRGDLRRSETAGGRPDPFPVTDPTMTFDQVAEAAHRHLPGAHFRHRLGFRYTLAWTKPGR
ncbi:class I SAM-dependent methyltransferase [Brevibacterium metallidurans]|uniref:Class I SAM-dependent methyltransferase n=1 Tax=Brevibacterium metallidurans TaxID=1482676 RepID=A0ABP3CBK0_9MICO